MTPARPAADYPDMVDIWSTACAELRTIKTAEDCDTCPHRKPCQRVADRLVSFLLNGQFRGGPGKKKRHAR